ncbi:MAG: polyribonucleotide nucleotidyltransferase, partial [Planctomycetota bacterium]
RPLFPEYFFYETQVQAFVFSYGEGDPVILSLLGASVALSLSDIPWNGPLGGVRVVQKDKKLSTFLSNPETANAELDFVVSYSKSGLIMVEGEAQEASEIEVLKAIQYAEKILQPFFVALEEMRQAVGKPKREIPAVVEYPELLQALQTHGKKLLESAFTLPVKQERREKVAQASQQLKETILAEHPEWEPVFEATLETYQYQLVRDYMLREKKRLDGRPMDQIRPISGEVGWLPRAHGSAIFTRGETQALVTCTLGTSHDVLYEDRLYGTVQGHFFLHYNFPSYSVGEVRPNRGPGRREIGHGNLALRALKKIVPDEKTFPYTIRIVSDISQSNGSSSMATVCGACLSLMNAGVPIKKPVAGIAMGLISEKQEFLILSDILGDEDHLGDMDFKICGTAEGITAVQMDNKIGSLPSEVLRKALDQARVGRLFILGEMKKILPQTAISLSDHAPQFENFTIRKERIRDLIGPGGKTIQSIQLTFDVEIQVSQEGVGQIFGKNRESVRNALKQVQKHTEEPTINQIYTGTIVSVKDFGVFVRILQGTEGLVHVSELSDIRISIVSDLFKEGQELKVKVLGVDDRGRIKLSHKATL